jgi:hypothetical protein
LIEVAHTNPNFEKRDYPSSPVAKFKTIGTTGDEQRPRLGGVEEIRIPSQRASRERERRRAEGILVDRAVIAALEAL